MRLHGRLWRIPERVMCYCTVGFGDLIKMQICFVLITCTSVKKFSCQIVVSQMKSVALELVAW
jgi:hypothetical protein